MKTPLLRLLAVLAVAFMSAGAFAQDSSSFTLKHNQTLGCGSNELLLFTCTQSFDCVDQPRTISISTEPRVNRIFRNSKSGYARLESNPRSIPPDYTTATIRVSLFSFWFPCFPWTTTRIPVMPFRAMKW
jgi:hypothetical protein